MTIFYFFASWCFLSIFWASNKLLAVDRLALLIQAWLLAGFITFLFAKKVLTAEKFFGGIIFLAVIESLIGLAQVILQKSVGLYLLGEPHLNVLDPTIAKTIVMGGGRLLRAYGTFPHPNILGAFLVVGLFGLIYLYLISSNAKNQISNKDQMIKFQKLFRFWNLNFICNLGFVICSFFIILGLILTFSRAAWYASGVGLLFLFFTIWRHEGFKKTEITKRLLKIIFMIIVSKIFIVAIFYWAIFPKVFISRSEPSVVLREQYLKIGWEIFKQHPLIGVGIGNQALYAVKNNIYKQFGLIKEINWQPTHNIYLLILNETGIIGLGLFLLFLGMILRKKFSIFYFLFSIFLVLGLFDHFLWTLPAGQLMFWTFGFLSLSL